MKKYSSKEWAKLTPIELETIVKESNPNYRWCALHDKWDLNWWPNEKQPDGFTHTLDLGWMCSCFNSSSGWPGVPGRVSWPLHKCSSAQYTDILWSLFIGVFVMAVIVLIAYK